MNNLSQLIKPARQHNEIYEDYAARRKEGNEAIKKFLKGRFIWVANKIVHLKFNAKGLPVIPGAKGVDGVTVRTIPIRKKVDGTYDHKDHGMIGTPRHKPTSKGQVHKYQFGYGR